MRRTFRNRTRTARNFAESGQGRLAPRVNGATAPAEVFYLDDLDREIVLLLQENGRISNAAIARTLRVTETTVRKRIERLISEGFIRITAVIDPRKTPYQVTAVIWMRLERKRSLEVARRIAEFPNVLYVGHTTGPYDLLVEAVFESDDALFAFLTSKLTSSLGVLQSETYHVVHTVKINYDWRPPLGPSDAGARQSRRKPKGTRRVRSAKKQAPPATRPVGDGDE